MYNVVWTYLISWLLPWFLNLTDHNQWLAAITKPIRDLYNDFIAFKDETLYELNITGQVIYLEMLLNDKFNGSTPAWIWNGTDFTYTPNTPNAIYILDNPNRINPFWLWTRAEGRPPVSLRTRAEVTADPSLSLFLYSRAEYNQQADFVVYVPSALANVTTDTVFVTQMKGWLNKYKQAGARYKIVNY